MLRIRNRVFISFLALLIPTINVLIYTRNTAYKLVLFVFGHREVQIGAYTEPTSVALKNSFLIYSPTFRFLKSRLMVLWIWFFIFCWQVPVFRPMDLMVEASPRRIFANAHTYHINSISINSDYETYLSADDLRINLWHLEITDRSFSIHLTCLVWCLVKKSYCVIFIFSLSLMYLSSLLYNISIFVASPQSLF